VTARSDDWGGHTGPLTGKDMLSSFGAPEVTVTPLSGGSLGPVTSPAAEPAEGSVGTDSVGTDSVGTDSVGTGPVGTESEHRVPSAPGHLVPDPSLPGPSLPGAPAPSPSRAGAGRRRPPAGRGRSGGAGRSGSKRRYVRLAAALVLFAGLIGFGFTTEFAADATAEPVVQQFLIDWQQGHYTDAARLTNGDPADVSTQLTAAYRNLNATAMFMSMDSVKRHGDTAEASFTATVDLAGGSHQWKYQGHFGVVSVGGHWLINWAPSVIEPHMQPGDRLAVTTKFPPRAQVTDATGAPLLPLSTVYHVGVYPGKLASVRKTASGFAAVTGLNQQQVLGYISSSPPHDFLSLLTLDPASFARMWPSLSHVRGITEKRGDARLSGSSIDEAVGSVDTEDSSVLRDVGAAYQPGMTIGKSGLEAAYQDTLAGSPQTSVIIVNAVGAKVATLRTFPGQAGTPVRTTIKGSVQAAASAALAAIPSSGEIVAVDSATGNILALASHNDASRPLPPGGLLNARIRPGIAFTIVSAAALLRDGLPVSSPLPCQDVANVGGQTFTYLPGQSTSATFAADFAAGCGTAFATASLRLTPANLAAAEKAFGLGAPWDLQVQAFSGKAATAPGEAGLAAQAIGASGVEVSPLAMAMIAAEVSSGVGHAPALRAGDPPATWQAPLSVGQLSALRSLMHKAVQSGPAHAANLSGTPVHGQAGVVRTGPKAWLSWFVGYRGGMAFAILQTGHTQAQAAASLGAAFLSAVG
jgi:Penicillin binding protein transpeptidase domain/NTF2-like N-terminal transpeptidase domain/Penicillin-binding Protein dimerisation domain